MNKLKIISISFFILLLQLKLSAQTSDSDIFESPFRDLYSDTWVATDNLGRTLPDYNEVGPVKTDKERVVGIFYITWHIQSHYTRFSSPYYADVTKILEANPNARMDAYDPLWHYNSYSYHWGEPEMGYFLSQDEFVIRKDMAMLANAGVDVLILDVTNAVMYWDEWEVLFSTMEKMKAEGNKVPKFCFWAFNGQVINVVQQLYEAFYKTERYKDLWFYWNDKPLLLYNAKPLLDGSGREVLHPNPHYDADAVTNPDNPHYGDPYYTQEYYTDYSQEVKDFFSKRNMWWGYYYWIGQRYVGTEDNWSFGYNLHDDLVKNLDPDDLVSTHNGRKEQAAVTPAQHSSGLVGKCWTRENGEPLLNEYDLPVDTYVPWLGKTVKNPEGYGIYFQDRWDEALASDPDFLYLNDWNEWTAGKFHDGAVNPFMRRTNNNFYFVDQYNGEFNRTIQPMKGGYSDNYYMQMVQNIRKYKGVHRQTIREVVSDINIDNDFSDWNAITHEFRDAIGDTRHRDHNGYGGLHYTNTTGRNDIMCSKVTFDKDSLYFYVKTVRDLTNHNDPNWMLLFIDADRNKKTGWEGYDWMINKAPSSDSVTSLQAYTPNGWGDIHTIAYKYSGTEMEIGIPRSLIGMGDVIPEFYFHWADNPQSLDDISAFALDGESAPDRRFNYSFKLTVSTDGYYYPTHPFNINQGLKCELYEGIFDTIPVFNTIKLSETYYPSKLELPSTNKTDYALRYTGFVDVPDKETYTFTLNAGLAAQLFIDDVLVVETKDGQGEQSGSINLMSGKHTLFLAYITKAGNTQSLNVSVESGSLGKDIITSSMLYKHNVEPDIELSFYNQQNYFCELDTVAVLETTDPDGSIKKVEVYENDSLLTDDIASKYFSNFSIGEHSIYATVTDNDSVQIESSVLNFNVKAAFAVPGSIPVEDYRAGTSNYIIDSDDTDGGISLRNAYGSVNYPINVTEAGTYTIRFRVPASASKKNMIILINGNEIKTVNIGQNNTDNSWCDVYTNINLEEGVQLLGFDFKSLITIHQIEFEKTSISSAEYQFDNSLVIWPNPSSGVFNVRSQKKIANITLLDMTGRVLEQLDVVDKTAVLNVGENLHAGTFFVTINYADGSVQSQKVISVQNK